MPGPPPAAGCAAGAAGAAFEAGAAGAAGAGAAGAAAGAAGVSGVAPAEADLLIPPWPLQAPRPPCGEVVPSLHVTGPLEAGAAVLWALVRPGAVPSAAINSAPQIKPLKFLTLIFRLLEDESWPGRQNTPIPRAWGTRHTQVGLGHVGTHRSTCSHGAAHTRRGTLRARGVGRSHRGDHGHPRLRRGVGG